MDGARAASPAFERVLDGAERLFSERGYRTVTIRDLAEELGLHPSSFYSHVRGGKEELYVAVMVRGLRRHGAGITQALNRAGPDLRAQLLEVARHFASQPRLALGQIRRADLPLLAEEHARSLSVLAYQSLLQPLEGAVKAAVARGEVDPARARTLPGAFVALVDAFRDLEEFAGEPDATRRQLIDLLFEGVRPRPRAARPRQHSARHAALPQSERPLQSKHIATTGGQA